MKLKMVTRRNKKKFMKSWNYTVKIYHLKQKISEYDNNQNALLEDRGKL